MASETVGYVVTGIYTFILASITLYCLLQFHLLYHYRRSRKTASQDRQQVRTDPELPFVTIQLPVFNEPLVAGRLLDNIVKLDYPEEKLEIQVLDDSTDETSNICLNKTIEYQAKGIPIVYYHRKSRDGYKAGALSEGLKNARGEFIAVFDADFLPGSDFLLRTVPYFDDPQVGVVQTRWEHINESYSLITRLQAFQLNVHFTVEQSGRQHGNYLLQFNGTAGIWRKKAIVDAGGWKADTLTEDLDLSYRAQIRGWKIIYRQDIVSPAELPSEMIGLKSQQFRWMKGGAENAKRLIPLILRSRMPLLRKMHAATHLLSSTIFLFIFLLAVLSVPVLFLMHSIHIDGRLYVVFMVGLLATGSIYYVANTDTAWHDQPLYKKLIRFASTFPLFLSLSMGLSLHNSIAVIQGYIGKKSVFVRTPKFNIRNVQDEFRQGFFNPARITGSTLIEGLLSVYFLVAIIAGVEQGKTAFILYHIMLMFGFGGIFYFSVKHAVQR